MKDFQLSSSKLDGGMLENEQVLAEKPGLKRSLAKRFSRVKERLAEAKVWLISSVKSGKWLWLIALLLPFLLAGLTKLYLIEPTTMMLVDDKLGSARVMGLIPSFSASSSAKAHKGAVSSLAFSQTSAYAASSGFDGQVKLWDLAAGRLMTTIRPPEPSGNLSEDALYQPPAPAEVKVRPVLGLALRESAEGQLLLAFRWAEGPSDLRTAVVLYEPLSGQSWLSEMRQRGEQGPYRLSEPALADALVWQSDRQLMVASLTSEAVLFADLPGMEITAEQISGNNSAITATFKTGNQLKLGTRKGFVYPDEGPIVNANGSACEAQKAILAMSQVQRTATSTFVDRGGSERTSTSVNTETTVLTADGTLMNCATGEIHAIDSGEPIAIPSLIIEGSLVLSAVFSPDGSKILTASSDKTARLWDAKSGREITAFSGHEGRVRSAVFSPDGSKILTASEDKTARLWDAKSGNEITAFSGHVGSVYSAVFSPDESTILTASYDMTARLWDAKSGRKMAVFIGHQDSVYSAVFSPDGSKILTASRDYTARLWDAKSGREITVFIGHQGWVLSAVFSPNGSTILTASWDKAARLWDPKSGREITAFSGHESEVNSAVFSPDGSTILTASDDKTARLWDAKSGREMAVFIGHEGPIYNAVFFPDGSTILTASRDYTARLWDAKSGREISAFSGHKRGVNSAVFSPDGSTILTVSLNNTVRLWKIVPTSCKHCHLLVAAGDGSYLAAGSRKGRIFGLDPSGGTRKYETISHGNTIAHLWLSDSLGMIISVADDGFTRLWDLKTSAPIGHISGHGHHTMAAQLSPDGRKLLTGGLDGTLLLADLEQHQWLHPLDVSESAPDLFKNLWPW